MLIKGYGFFFCIFGRFTIILKAFFDAIKFLLSRVFLRRFLRKISPKNVNFYLFFVSTEVEDFILKLKRCFYIYIDFFILR